MYFNSKLKMLERRQQQVRELRAKHEVLLVELEDTKARLMMHPSKWTGECKSRLRFKAFLNAHEAPPADKSVLL